MNRGMMRFAGLSLLAMAILAGVASLGMLEKISSADSQLHALREHESLARFAVLAFMVVAVLDVLVAWALQIVTQVEHADLARLAATFRYLYAAVLAVATGALLMAVNSVEGSGAAAESLATDMFTLFQNVWDAGLLLFGCHLITLGIIFVWAVRLPGWLGWLLILAGAGYLADTLIASIAPGFGFEFGSVLFVGEVVLLGWLIWQGFNPKSKNTPSNKLGVNGGRNRT